MMNKFYGPDDKNYELVSAEIRYLAENHASTLDERSRGNENDNYLHQCHQVFKTTNYERHKTLTQIGLPAHVCGHLRIQNTRHGS